MRINKLIKTKYKVKIKGIKTNSKDIKKSDVFVCTLGTIDKKAYIDDALLKGCSFVVVNEAINQKIPYAVVQDLDLTLKNMLDRYYHYPLSKINLVGVTGTDGKTTITTILKDMMNGASIGTNGFVCEEKVKGLNNTTPSLDKVYECLNEAIKKRKKEVFMEVSSESYLTNRLPNLFFDIGVFTNITKDHLDKHKTFENYFNCKMQLLKNSGVVILNRDSKYFNKIKKVNVNYRTYGFKKSDLIIKKYRMYLDRTYIKFSYQDVDYHLVSPLVGLYNVYNLMACILVMLELNYSMKEILNRVKLIKKVPGRNEIIYKKNFLVIIDHAHTINATKSILRFIKKFVKRRLIVVLGCAGGRYKEKRKVIGRLALKYADIVIFTMDDPRNEEPRKIIDDMLKGNKYFHRNYYIVINRKYALEKAIELAKENDIVLVLGRGRDKIMHLKEEDVIHSDYDELMKILRNQSLN